jgi:hypothetical protein
MNGAIPPLPLYTLFRVDEGTTSHFTGLIRELCEQNSIFGKVYKQHFATLKGHRQPNNS